jgi:hypothetical protein
MERPEVDGPDEVAGVATVAAPAPAGEGVAGTAGADVVVEGAGAAGGAGVEATAGVGVEGAFDVDAAEDGAALG